ncbi:MAG: hypothetical protein Q4C60_01925 [Eubacteriales bacterium]|nr:hypothetical protein [Eubacteriales bacterium]
MSTGKKKIICAAVLVELLLIVILCVKYALSDHYSVIISADQMNPGAIAQYNERANVIEPIHLQTDPNNLLLLNAYAEGVKKGIYDITVHYKTEMQGNSVTIGKEEKPESSVNWLMETVLNDTIFLPHHFFDTDQEESHTFRIWTTDYVGELRIDVNYLTDGPFSVSTIEVRESSAVIRVAVMKLVVFFLILDFLYLYAVHCRKVWTAEKKGVIAALAGSVFLACIPLMVPNLWRGDDILFHVQRLTGLIEGLRAGQFPVRLQPNWWDGRGYDVSIFYGDAFLYLPAFLYLVGLTLQSSIQIFLAVLNGLTCLVMYFCTKRMMRGTWAAVTGAALYTLSLYRLVDLYYRFALGEAIAMTFVPLVLYGFWCVLSREATEQEKQYSPLIIALGLSGIIQSHVLTTEMVGLFILLTCLIFVRKVIQKNCFFRLLQALVLTILMNMWFLLPFLTSFMERGGTIYTTDGVKPFQHNGALPYELLEIFPNTGQDTPPKGIGLALLLTLILYASQNMGKFSQNTGTKCEGETGYREARSVRIFGRVLFGYALLATAACLRIIPYEFFQKRISVVNDLIGNLQFPWRFLVVVTVCACFLAALVQERWRRSGQIAAFWITAAVFCGLTLLSGLAFMQNICENAEVVEHYATEGVRPVYAYYDYLSENMVPSEVIDRPETSSEEVVLSEAMRTRKDFSFQVRSEAETEESVSLPLMYFPGYQAADESGNVLETVMGENGCIEVKISPHYAGSVTVAYQASTLYQGMDLLSLLVWMSILVIVVGKRFAAKYCGRLPERHGKAGL